MVKNLRDKSAIISVEYDDLINPKENYDITINPVSEWIPTKAGVYKIISASKALYYNGERVLNDNVVVNVFENYNQSENSYGISNPTTWKLFDKINAMKTLNYHLTQDINFTSLENATILNIYLGNFNGNGFTITNWKSINGGLFNKLEGNVRNVYIVGNGDFIIPNSTTMGAIGILANNTAGNVSVLNIGISNFNVRYTKTIAWSTSANKYAGSELGGIVGSHRLNALTIENCYFTGNLYRQNSGQPAAVGGIMGGLQVCDINIKNCYSKCDIEQTGTNYILSSGIIGNIEGSGNRKIENSYFRGNLIGTANPIYSSGIGGRIWGNSTVINNVFSYIKDKTSPICYGLYNSGGSSAATTVTNCAYYTKYVNGSGTSQPTTTWTADAITKSQMEQVLSSGNYAPIKENTTPILLVNGEVMKYQIEEQF